MVTTFVLDSYLLRRVVVHRVEEMILLTINHACSLALFESFAKPNNLLGVAKDNIRTVNYNI